MAPGNSDFGERENNIPLVGQDFKIGQKPAPGAQPPALSMVSEPVLSLRSDLPATKDATFTCGTHMV